MKRILAIIISIMLIASCAFTGLTASAAGNLSLSVESKTAKRGDTVSVAVKITANSGISFLSVSPSFDSNNLTLTETVKGDVFNGMSDGKSPTFQNSGENLTKTGKLLTFTFKVNENATIKDYSISVIVRQCYDEQDANVTAAVSAGTLKVSCKTHTYGDWEKNNAANHKHTCSACGDVAYENHKWDAGTQTKPADCKEAGNKKYTCTVCGEIKNEPIPKTNNHTYGSFTETKPATCTTTGTKTRTCSTCQKVDTQTIAKLGHKMGAWKTTKEATCEAKGTKVRECERDNCNHKETQDIAALRHKFSNPTVTKEPTCTETGIETGTCTRCKKETTNTIKAKGHSFDKWEDVKAATCTEAGEQKRKCKNCDHTETKKVDALGHDFENPTVITEPTIATTGIAEGKCKRCGEVTQQILPCKATDATTGIVFEAEQGVFQSGTQITVTEIKRDAADFANIQTALKSVAENFKVYDIDAVLNGAVVQSTGKYKATFAIPEDFGTKVAVYGIAADGTATLIESVVSEDGKTVTAEISDYSYYTVCDLSSVESNKADAPVKDGDDKGEGKDNSLIIYIAIGALVLLIIAGVVIFIVMKKKKVTAEVSEPDDTFTIE